MKIKTYQDNRTFEEVTGRRIEEETNKGSVYIVTPEEEKRRQARIKPEPPHHVFDIELKPGTPARVGEIPAEEFLFVSLLFFYYSQSKKYWRHESNQELKTKFSVPNFLRHHEVTGKKDIDRIKEISFLIGYSIGHDKGAEVDKLRPEIFSQLDLYLLHKPTPQAPPPAGLESIFSDSQNLTKLVKLLKDKNFVSEEAGRLYWTNGKRGFGVEFAAMTKVCMPLISEKNHRPKILHKAWTNYFSHKSKPVIISETYFKGSQKENEIYPHLVKFEFIKTFFNIK